MRKIIVYNIISLDGYHTGLDNDVSVMFPMMGDKAFDEWQRRLRRRSTCLRGQAGCVAAADRRPQLGGLRPHPRPLRGSPQKRVNAGVDGN